MRISATTLELFRLCQCAILPWSALEDAICRRAPVTSRMRLGSSYGQVLADPDAARIALDLFGRTAYRAAAYPEFVFPPEMVDPALARIDRAGVFEEKRARQYGPHTVVAVADHLLGAQLSEFKTRRGAIDCARYYRSYQWRYMVDIFQPAAVTYLVFGLRVRPMALVDTQVFSVYRATRAAVDAVHQQCCVLLAAFLRFVRTRGLEAYLPDRVEDRPAPVVRTLTGPRFEDTPTRKIEPRRRARVFEPWSSETPWRVWNPRVPVQLPLLSPLTAGVQ